ncbi:MAG: hypothetical protein ABIB71_06985 [Candidatus Woesearchaeota archaeon]
MQQFRTQEETYDRCISEGKILPRENVELDKAKANLQIAEEDLASAEEILQKKRWNSAYKMYYDALHGLVEAYLSFDKVKSMNHQCLFVYLCEKHPELELDWGFFEKVRTKRNGIHYYGTLVAEDDWKAINVQFKLYINVLKKALEQRIKDFEDSM